VLISQDAKATVIQHPVTLDYSFFGIQWVPGMAQFGIPA